MRIHFAAIAAGMLALAGCQTIQKVETIYDQVQAAYRGAPKTVYVLRSGYDIVQTAAATFKATQCPAVTSLGGKCATIVPVLRRYNQVAIDALNDAESFVRTHPDADASTIIAAAEGTITTVSKAMTDLGVTP